MQIKRLRLAGFKSFVDPADLRIEPGLTGVVGPNGCGKSNLLEALRWAMGENSAKSLRGGGMEDVIFAGTAMRPARDFAEVSILAEVEGDETEVVRRIERGGGSAYRIDGRDVRARDVALLFADSATGAHSPALVSQNRIGAVIAAKPADRRAMLEEAAGIAGLHVRRKDAETRLRATEANLQRLDELIAEQDARAGQLRRQARAAERYRTLSAQIRLAEARAIFARWREAAAAADDARAQAAEAEGRVQLSAQAERAAAAEQTRAAAALAEARQTSLAARDRASEAGHRLAALRTERATAERQLAELAEAGRRIVEDRAREGALANDAAEALARLDTESQALAAAVAEADRRGPGLDRTLAEAERLARDADVAQAQALTRHASEAVEARVAAAALTAARTRLDRAKREATSIAAALTALGEAGPLASERGAAADRRAAAIGRAETARAALASADSNERTAIAARDAAESRRAEARAELAALDGEAAALARASQRDARDDRLVDHVTATPGYERALAAALDDSLNTPLAAWAGAEPQPGDPPPPAGTTPLSAHVEAPPVLARRLAQIFVAERDTGRPLAVGQSLVTPAGALRRWDGFTATGGGAATAERLQRLNRLDALKRARPPAAEALTRAEGAVGRANAAISELRRATAAARAGLSTAEGQARDAEQSEGRAAMALERLAGQRSDLEARTARATAEAEEATAEHRRAAAAAATLPDGSAALDALATLRRDADESHAAVVNARSERQALERHLAASRERLAAVTADAQGWRARAGEAARRIADLKARATELATTADALTGRPALLDAQIAALDAEHKDARGSADRLAAAEREAEAALRLADSAHRAAGEALAAAREARAGAMARADNQEQRRAETARIAGERFDCPAAALPQRLGFDAAAVRGPTEESAAHDRLTAERERIGPVNLVAERELAELDQLSAANAGERTELGQAVNRLRGSIGTLNREGRERLLAAFTAVDAHFRRLFTTLFDGGAAHLALVDADDPLEAGLEIMAQPPGKRLQSLTLLSGGEQALTAIALIFALFLTSPAPICVLDEVDAPLDDANIERFCDLLDYMTRETDTRYLIVTHNAVTMSRMHRLFGVTMIERGVSRLVSVDLQAAETLLAAE